jgi:hypothetical protein
MAVSFIDGGNHRPVASCIEYISPWTGLKLMLVVIGTDCTGSCKSIYHTITTMMAPIWYMYIELEKKRIFHKLYYNKFERFTIKFGDIVVVIVW